MKNTLLFIYSRNILVRLLTVRIDMKNCLTGKHYMVAHHIVVQHKLIEHCVQRLVSSTHFSKLLFSVLSTPRLSLVSFYVLLCTY